ncbi:hypothetical protein ONZ45_g16752 [Pleurotus djamor]|nr:hypothetical protein ONZ45_g16752 [Pleurotus djamor]
MDAISHIVDTSKPSLYLSLFSIAFNPTVWNIVARNEYRKKTITRIFGGDPYKGCYFLAFMIFTFGLLRDSLYHKALEEQPKMAILPERYATLVPAIMFGLGQLFVITSTWSLGITGTFLGDYFGILMDHRVEG